MPPAAPQPVGITLRRLRVALTLHRKQQGTRGPKRNSRRGPNTHRPQGPQTQHVLPLGVDDAESVGA